MNKFITVNKNKKNNLSVVRLTNALKINTDSIESVKLTSKNLTFLLGKEFYVWGHELQIVVKEGMNEDGNQLRLIMSNQENIASSIELAMEITKELGVEFTPISIKVKEDESNADDGVSVIIRGKIQNTEEFTKLFSN